MSRLPERADGRLLLGSGAYERRSLTCTCGGTRRRIQRDPVYFRVSGCACRSIINRTLSMRIRGENIRVHFSSDFVAIRESVCTHVQPKYKSSSTDEMLVHVVCVYRFGVYCCWPNCMRYYCLHLCVCMWVSIVLAKLGYRIICGQTRQVNVCMSAVFVCFRVPNTSTDLDRCVAYIAFVCTIAKLLCDRIEPRMRYIEHVRVCACNECAPH